MVTLYINTSDNRKIGKSLTSAYYFANVEFKRPCEMLNPTIILHNITNITQYNYCYIGDFGRYYFIDEIQVLTGGRVSIKCSIDVLETYATEIKALNAILLRGEIGQPTEITDNLLPLAKNKSVNVYEFTGGDFNINTATNANYNFVLNIMGGGAS